MEYRVGSLANFINEKADNKGSNTTLFENISNSVKNINFKVIPINKNIVQHEESAAQENNYKRKLDEDDDSQPTPKKAKSVNSLNAERRIKGSTAKSPGRVVIPDEDKRTIFVGNLPCNIKIKKLKNLFKTYGEIESARLRCPPIKDPKIPKKVAVIKKEFHPDRTNIVGFVRFASEEAAINAVQANGLEFQGHHLRVDISTSKGFNDQKKAVFVGNLHFGAEENDLWKMFSECGPIEGIRIVRDPSTGVGKGFAYVNFKDISSVELAMQLDGKTLKDRPLRIKRSIKKVTEKNDKWKRPMLNRTKEFKRRKPELKDRTIRNKNVVSEGNYPVSKKQDVKNKDREESSSVKNKRRKLRINLKESGEKGKNKIKASKKDEPSYLGTKVEDELAEKKDKKLSKAAIKKKVLSFQLQWKEFSQSKGSK